jgi:GTP cyclohydrolase IA
MEEHWTPPPIPVLMTRKQGSLLEEGWKYHLGQGIAMLLSQEHIVACTSLQHVRDTSARVVSAYEEYFWGCKVNASSVLDTTFPTEGGESYDEMIVVTNMDFVSWCSHHLLPFIGVAHFAYLPNTTIVGLSKIPRLLEVLAARPQVQENLTSQFMNTFLEVVKPNGCAAVVEAKHMCMGCRGVKQPNAETVTVSLSDVFKVSSVKSEFFNHIERSKKQ